VTLQGIVDPGIRCEHNTKAVPFSGLKVGHVGVVYRVQVSTSSVCRIRSGTYSRIDSRLRSACSMSTAASTSPAEADRFTTP
jgi:hypothetical protein